MLVVEWKLMRGILRRMLHVLPGRSCVASSGTGRARVEGVMMMMMMMMMMSTPAVADVYFAKYA